MDNALQTIAALRAAADNNEGIKVRYFGGSQPGAEREILPLAFPDGFVLAKCKLSGTTKTYRLDKIEIVTKESPSVVFFCFPFEKKVYANLNDLFAGEKEELESMGWVVKHQEGYLSLHRLSLKKTGKPIQSSDVSILYQESSSDLVFDGYDFSEENTRKRIRPWTVRGKNETTKTYSEFHKAQFYFLELAQKLSPIEQG